MLVLSIVVVALVTFRTSFVPVLEEEAEASFADQVAESLLAVRSNLDAHVGDEPSGRLSVPLATNENDGPPLAPERPDDRVRFRSGSETVTVYASNATVWRQNGTLLVRENPDWEPVPGTELTVPGIDRVLDLRVRIDSVSAADDGEQLTVRAVGADGGLQGRITYTIEDTRSGPGGPERSQIVAEVENTAGNIVFDQTVATFTEAQTDYEIDVLDPLVGFDQILTRADNPMRLVIVENGVIAERAMTLRVRDAGTDRTVVSPGGGAQHAPLKETFRGGALVYESRTSFFVDQTYTIEHGALLLQQGDRATLRAAPHFSAGLVDEDPLDPRAKAGFGLPLLTGTEGSVAGSDAVSVATRTTRPASLSAVASEVSLNLTTTAPEAWARWTSDRYTAGGLSAFSIETGPTWMNVTVEGPALTDTADVNLDLQTARIETRLER